MARKGRPPKADKTVQWCFMVPSSLATQFDGVLVDPLLGRIMPNQRQDIFIPLLERLWQATLSGQQTIEVGDLVANLRIRILPLEDFI